MENIIIINFGVESEAFQAFSELKGKVVSDSYLVSQALIVKNTDGQITILDGLDTGAETSNDTAIGGLVGALVGIAGGPLGMLLMGSYGALLGSMVDLSDAAVNASLMELVLDCVTEDKAVLIAVVQEDENSAFESVFANFNAEITRFDAAEVAAEIAEAERVQEEMAKLAKKELREAKKNDRQKEIEDRKAKIKNQFSDLKAKFKKNAD